MEDKSIRHEREFKSFVKRFNGKKLIWFKSLSDRKQHDLLFEWKKHKYSRRHIKTTQIIRRMVYNYGSGKREVKEMKLYPANFKHFISQQMKTRKYFVSISKIRETSLEILGF